MPESNAIGWSGLRLSTCLFFPFIVVKSNRGTAGYVDLLRQLDIAEKNDVPQCDLDVRTAVRARGMQLEEKKLVDIYGEFVGSLRRLMVKGCLLYAH